MRCWRPDRPFCWVLLALCPLTSAADSITGSVFGARFPANQSAYGGSLTLQHSIDDGGVLLGLSDSSYPVGSLAVVDLDAYSHPMEHLYASVGASLGNAQAEGHSSALYKARMAFDAQWDPAWLFHAADQFLELNVIHGHLVNAGIEYRPTPHWGLNVSGGYSVSGTLADRYGQIALNWYGKSHVFGGLVLGRTGYDPANLGEISVVKRQFQAYFGIATPLGGGSLTLGVDTLNLEGDSRQTLQIGFVEPINL